MSPVYARKNNFTAIASNIVRELVTFLLRVIVTKEKEKR
jgi:hypothetical protein